MALQLFISNFEFGTYVLSHTAFVQIANPEKPVYQLTLLKLIKNKINFQL